MQDPLFERDRIRERRRRLRPLGWLVLCILLLFLLTLCAALLRGVTHNVSQVPATLRRSPTPHPTQVNTRTLPIPSPTVPLCAAWPITWTVTATQDISGTASYQAPPAIQQWVIASYLGARAWAEQNKFDVPALRAHLSDYFTDAALNRASADLDELAQTHLFVSAGSPQLLPQGRQIAFDASGRQATIRSYLAASTNEQFDLSSRERVADGDHPPLDVWRSLVGRCSRNVLRRRHSPGNGPCNAEWYRRRGDGECEGVGLSRMRRGAA